MDDQLGKGQREKAATISQVCRNLGISVSEHAEMEAAPIARIVDNIARRPDEDGTLPQGQPGRRGPDPQAKARELAKACERYATTGSDDDFVDLQTIWVAMNEAHDLLELANERNHLAMNSAGFVDSQVR